ncbi:MAG: alpha/beta fold hydrolase [Candidatus Promineifilaceae bacterium]|nr:alpha/beta fold hydrolase [Candidatus Promineifilaceae bacterium]
MITFRRSLRVFFGVVGFLFGLALAATVYLARMMISPQRQALWASPQDVGLDYEDVQFPARDGLRVSGWFIPTKGDSHTRKATIVVVHSWQWNRLGYAAHGLFANVSGSKQIDLLNLIHELHDEDYHVLTFDLRNHGQSASAPPVTFGQSEAKDLLGALNYLVSREDVDPEEIGVIGFSIGANAALFAMPQTSQIKAIVAVQPTTPSLFSKRLTADLLGVFGPVIRLMVELIYRLFGGPRLAGIDPAFAARGAGDTPVLFVQGAGDNWGSMDDVSQMAEITPKAQELLFVRSAHRFDGYRYVIDNPGPAITFFRQYLKDK